MLEEMVGHGKGPLLRIRLVQGTPQTVISVLRVVLARELRYNNDKASGLREPYPVSEILLAVALHAVKYILHRTTRQASFWNKCPDRDWPCRITLVVDKLEACL